MQKTKIPEQHKTIWKNQIKKKKNEKRKMKNSEKKTEKTIDKINKNIVGFIKHAQYDRNINIIFFLVFKLQIHKLISIISRQKKTKSTIKTSV